MILERFHKGDVLDATRNKGKKLWKKVALIKKFVGSGVGRFTLTGKKKETDPLFSRSGSNGSVESSHSDDGMVGRPSLGFRIPSYRAPHS